MSSPVVVYAVSDGEFQVRRPYKPSRRGWWIAGQASMLAFMLGVTVSIIADVAHWSLPPWSHTAVWAPMLLSCLLRWCAEDTLRSRFLRRETAALELDSEGIRVPSDRSLAAPWNQITARVDIDRPREDLQPSEWLRLRLGKATVAIPLRLLDLNAARAQELIYTASSGSCSVATPVSRLA